VITGLVTSFALVSVTPSPTAEAATSKCAVLTHKVHKVVDRKSSYVILTANTARVASLKKDGFRDKGVLFTAGSRARGLVAVRTLYNRRTRDRIYTYRSAEVKAFTRKGYAVTGVGFYAYTSRASCLSPVYRLTKKGAHRFAMAASYTKSLKKAGWRVEGVAFYAGSPAGYKPTAAKPPTKPPTDPGPTGDTKFTIAVIPDTQQEVLRASDSRFANRTRWLAANKKVLDIRFATHTGDIVNWDTPDHGQYKVARTAMAVLNQAGIPYSMSPGNHDTAAVCDPGGACDPHRTRQLVRDTSSFNTYLDGGTADLAGRFEANKLDNTYSTFSAGSRKWLVLNLELWPRTAVVAWARQVVAAHPTYNVIVATHSYLTSGGGIGIKSEYGATSPKYLYDNLISKYPNVKMVLCGHVGKSYHRVDYGVTKNRIDTFLLAMHDNVTNPVRLIEIDTRANTLRTWVYAPYTKATYPSYKLSLSRLTWVS